MSKVSSSTVHKTHYTSLVGPEGVEGAEQLDGWIERATKFVKTLPAK